MNVWKRLLSVWRILNEFVPGEGDNRDLERLRDDGECRSGISTAPTRSPIILVVHRRARHAGPLRTIAHFI